MKYISDYVDGFDIVEQVEKRFYSTASSFDKDWIEFTNTHPYVYKGDETLQLGYGVTVGRKDDNMSEHITTLLVEKGYKLGENVFLTMFP